MSEIVHIVGDLSGLDDVAAWRAATIDKKVVGKLSKGIGPLQRPTDVDDVLLSVEEIAREGATVVAVGDCVSVRAVVTDHQLHDLAAPLVGAFRLAGTRGARGTLVFVEGATDAPGFGHRLDVGDEDGVIRALKKGELGAKFVHPAKAELEALEAALAAAPPAPLDDRPAQLREVRRAERPAYVAVWDVIASADEAKVVAAVASALAWQHPDGQTDPALARLGSLTTKPEIVERLRVGDPGRVRGFFSLVWTLAPWIDAAATATASAQARVVGTWPRYLTPAVRGLVAGGAEAEAWSIFEAGSDDETTEIDVWHADGAATYGLAQSRVTTATLVERLDAALAKKTKPAEKRALGYALMLGWRKDDASTRAPIERSIAQTTGTLHDCLVAYLQRIGWR